MDLSTLQQQVVGRAMKSLPLSRRLWLSKHVARFAAVGYNMVRRKEWHSPACPRCSQTETHCHVWQCPNTEAQDIRSRGLDMLDNWLKTQDTDPDLRRVLLIRLFDWLEDQPYTEILPTQTRYYELITRQDSIGWELPFTGFWLQDWSLQQHLYYITIGSSKTGIKWLERFTIRIWKIAWDLWEHRNNCLHQRQIHYDRITLVARIQAIYLQPRSSYPPHLQQRMLPIARLLRQPLPQLLAWHTAFETYSSTGYSRSDPTTRQLYRLSRSLGVPLTIPHGPLHNDAWRTVLRALTHPSHAPV